MNHAISPRRLRVVVVTWQGVHLLTDCLRSLADQTLDPAVYEVVVVDNASTDGTRELLRRDFPDVDVVVSDVNLGFGGGVNLGLQGFDGDYAVLLNNDAVLDSDGLQILLDAMTAADRERVGAVTAKILLAGAYERSSDPKPPDGSLRGADGLFVGTSPSAPGALRLVNSTGNALSRVGAAYDRDWLKVEGTESVDRVVFGFCGGAAMLRMSALREVGGFDADLFLYYEDTDLSWRLRAHGWGVEYEPRAVAHHRHAASSDASSMSFRFYNLRNAMIVFTRHAPARVVARMLVRQVAALMRDVLRHGLRHELTRVRMRALLEFGRKLPTVVRQRRLLWRDTGSGRRTAVGAFIA